MHAMPHNPGPANATTILGAKVRQLIFKNVEKISILLT